MPIGKNSIKRVKNGGYSNVKSSAPDMENSTVIANPSKEVIEKMIPSAKSEPTKKCETKKKTSSTTKKATKPAVMKDTAKEKDGFVRFSLGCDLPEYLL